MQSLKKTGEIRDGVHRESVLITMWKTLGNKSPVGGGGGWENKFMLWPKFNADGPRGTGVTKTFCGKNGGHLEDGPLLGMAGKGYKEKPGSFGEVLAEVFPRIEERKGGGEPN